MRKAVCIFIICLGCTKSFSQPVDPVVNKIGISASSSDSSFRIQLVKRFQSKNGRPIHEDDIYDRSIYSPKSVNILEEKNKIYVQSLEGFSTSVYDLDSLKLKRVINHSFTSGDSALFKNEFTVLGYKYSRRGSNYNVFKGKPVESAFSHNGKYLWVTYYRRSYDKNAVDPSAVAIIDTDTDSIVRVMPTGPLPKMIASSEDNKFMAITHWGDNTIGVIDISGVDYSDFHYTDHLVVGEKMSLKFSDTEKVNRDNNCGYCLRGTVFTPDSKYLLVGRMGGGGIAIFDMETKEYAGTAFGMHANIRHIIIANEEILISTNNTGYVEKSRLQDLINEKKNNLKEDIIFKKWISKYIGVGVRTISISGDGKYVFAAVNNESKIVVLNANDLSVVTEIAADSYPVGMDVSSDSQYLIVTAQGRYKLGGGHSVMIYKVDY